MGRLQKSRIGGVRCSNKRAGFWVGLKGWLTWVDQTTWLLDRWHFRAEDGGRGREDVFLGDCMKESLVESYIPLTQLVPHRHIYHLLLEQMLTFNLAPISNNQQRIPKFTAFP